MLQSQTAGLGGRCRSPSVRLVLQDLHSIGAIQDECHRTRVSCPACRSEFDGIGSVPLRAVGSFRRFSLHLCSAVDRAAWLGVRMALEFKGET